MQTLKAISETDLSKLGQSLESLNRSLATSAVIAPAVIYEAGQSDLERLNRRLFSMGKAVGDAIGVPTFATVFFGRSITSAPSTLKQAISEATSLDADGWYFAFEFPPDDRLPSSDVDVSRCCDTGLTLAETGKPVLHAFAGPMSLISFGFGANGAGVAHDQIMWHFHRKRWEKPTGKGGGGDAPQRIFSTGLWGTIVDQDETLVIPKEILNEAVVQTPYSSVMMINLPLDKRSASRHLVCSICKFVDSRISPFKAREAANRAVEVLDRAVALHARIREQGIYLKDNTDVYQAPWRNALTRVLNEQSARYDFLEMF